MTIEEAVALAESFHPPGPPSDLTDDQVTALLLTLTIERDRLSRAVVQASREQLRRRARKLARGQLREWTWMRHARGNAHAVKVPHPNALTVTCLCGQLTGKMISELVPAKYTRDGRPIGLLYPCHKCLAIMETRGLEVQHSEPTRAV